MPKIALPGEAWPTGYVFDVPKWRRNVPDSKPWRPFYLLNRVVPGDAATLALMTTKSTEVAYGATQFTVPNPKNLRLPGQDASYIEVSSILVEDSGNFSTASDNLSRYRAAVRTLLHTALGMGQGRGPGTDRESIRGFLVRLTRAMEREFGYAFGIVLTRHEYSRARRLQTVAPVIDLRYFIGPDMPPEAFEQRHGLIRPSNVTAAWLRQLPAEWAGHVLNVPLLNTFTEEWREHRDPTRWLPRQSTMSIRSPSTTRLSPRSKPPSPSGSGSRRHSLGPRWHRQCVRSGARWSTPSKETDAWIKIATMVASAAELPAARET